MKTKRIVATAVIATSMLTNTAFASDMYATRGEVADMLEKAADDYNAEVKRSDIIKGYGGDGELHEDWNINRAEALVMLSRAFGQLPPLSGHNERVALKSNSFNDIPEWAANELSPVLNAGIAAGTADGVFSPYDDVTKEQMELFIRRAYALFGTNERDDFYAAVNKSKLDSMQIKPGRTIAGTLYDIGDKSTEDVNEIIKEVIEKGGAYGSKEQKIADLYNSILDKESRNKIGTEPIKKYLELINNAKSADDLISVQRTLESELCLTPFMTFGIMEDLKDSTKYMPVFGTYEPIMTKDFYFGATAEQQNAYIKYLKTILSVCAEPADDETINTFLNFEKTLAQSMHDVEEKGDVDKIYNTFTLNEIADMFPNVDMNAVLAASGVQEESKILIADPELTKAFAAFVNDENTALLKTVAKINLIINYGGALNTEFTDASDRFNAEYLGIEGAYTDEERATLVVSSTMPDYIGEIYAKKHFSEAAKQNVTDMVYDIIAVYKERINNLDWMSAETKAKAIGKLDKMNIKIGYPDSFDTYLDSVEIKTAKDGGSYFDNIINIAKAMRDDLLSKQGQPVDKSEWLMYPYTVNACYSATANDITFPAAILQAPMYDINASYEENLGGIGYIIAHEITHAFDNNGAKFDENGNAADWWTAEDYSEFEKRCQKLQYFYDRQESIPGVPMNGKLTLSENVADQGAAQCITQVAAKKGNADYRKLYRSVANAWASTSTREYARYVAGLDVHSADKLRVNRVIVNCDEFYDAFGITENDGMWVAPQDRIKIW